jgi:hypothetical protein
MIIKTVANNSPLTLMQDNAVIKNFNAAVGVEYCFPALAGEVKP